MLKYQASAGQHIRHAVAAAMELAQNDGSAVLLSHNGREIIIQPGETEPEVWENWSKATGQVILTEENDAKVAREFVAKVQEEEQERELAIKSGGFPDEREMRESPAPNPKTLEDLAAEINTLVDRPHDYGTCVYAMSMAAVAAFNFVAHKLGVTGFQASCADMDILRRTRHMEHGFAIVNYDNVFYPQYWESEGGRYAPFYRQLTTEGEPASRKHFADAARAKLAKADEYGPPHPDVKAHWEKLAALWPEGQELPDEE